MRANGIDYVDVRVIYQPIQDFYALLEREPRLDWIARSYKPESGGTDHLQEWHMVRDKVRIISRWGHAIPFALLIICMLPMVFVGIICDAHHAADGFTLALIAPLMIGAVWVWVTLNNSLAGIWDELVKGWLSATWKGKDLADETWKVCLALGSEPYFNLPEIVRTLGSREGDTEGEIPFHVVQGAIDALAGKIEPVLARRGIASVSVSLGDKARRTVKNILELFQTFSILPREESVGHYYRLVEQKKA